MNLKKIDRYITEIPDNAFEGCSDLAGISCIGVTKIGANAFSGCSKLRTFSIDKYVTSVGENAFNGVNEIKVDAANVDVAKAAITSGAKRITLSIGNMSGSLDDTQIVIGEDTEYFGLFGTKSDKSAVVLKNVQIKSNAAEICLNNLIFVENEDTPLVIDSSKLTLNRVNIVDAPGFVAVLTADQTDVKLYGAVSLSSKGENSLICKSISLSKENESVSGKLITDGNVLVCGQVSNSNMLTFITGTTIYITEEQFNSYLTSSIITFNPNGGTVDSTTKTVYYGQVYGELPVPGRANYTFDGWYTEKDGGTKITADTSVTALVNQTLYAHWLPNKFTLTYNANGGTVSTGSKELTFGDSYGTLPTPTRDYYTFTGWYTAASGGTKVSASTTPASATDVTIYAQWELNDVKGPVKASEMPANAQVVSQEWRYTVRETTSNGSYPLSGWTHYDTQRTGWGAIQGPVYSDPNNGSRNVWPDQYETGRTKHWVYYRYVNPSNNYGSSSKWGNYTQYDEIDLTYELYHDSNSADSNAVTFYKADGKRSSYWFLKTYDEISYGTCWYYQEPVYTYYYYKDLAKIETSYPTDQSNVSNIVKWVTYREK